MAAKAAKKPAKKNPKPAKKPGKTAKTLVKVEAATVPPSAALAEEPRRQEIVGQLSERDEKIHALLPAIQKQKPEALA
ncbi:MAG: hypothetical protein JNJ69_13725, partial [Leptospiraceae bacterium]|nr:hypothetical protein [Leptospiraceae bacterium]